MTDKIISPAFSLKGWELKIWLQNNFWMVKEAIKVITPGVIAWLSTNNPYWVVPVAIIGKAVLDVFEYWIKEKRE